MNLHQTIVGTIGWLFSLASLSIAGVLWPQTAKAAMSSADSLFYSRYSYICILEDGEQPPTITDEQFFSQAGKVVFPVGRSELPRDSKLLRELDASVIPHLNADSLRLVRLVFRGAASPEGPTALNQRLGRQRVQSLFDFVTSRMKFPVADSLFTIDADIEDYRSLCLMMRQAGDADYGVVQGLVDRYADQAVLKQQLQAADGGKLWKRLLATYFPQLRTARFIMFLQKVTKPMPVAELEPATVPVTAPEPVEEEPPVLVQPVVVPEPEATAQMEVVESEEMLRRELLSVKTNLLFYAVYMPGYNRWCPIPNIAVEYYPKRGHFTFGASFDMPWWQDYDAHKYFQLRNYQIEGRYYLKTNNTCNSYKTYSRQRHYEPYEAPAFSGFYLQAYANTGIYGICFDADRGWVGEGVGGGVGCGYVLPLSRNGHWRVDFGLQVGYFHTKYDPYRYENPIDPAYHDDLYYYKWKLAPDLFKKRQYRFNWLGPTRVGITLSYDLLYRRIQKRGASFKSKERRGQYE